MARRQPFLWACRAVGWRAGDEWGAELCTGAAALPVPPRPSPQERCALCWVPQPVWNQFSRVEGGLDEASPTLSVYVGTRQATTHRGSASHSGKLRASLHGL